jgi:flavin-dependent dehydrogenase
VEVDGAPVDVAVVGAGPAGATLAALLAARGVRVSLHDRDRFPRDKVCGEFLSYDALPVLEPLGVVDALDRAGAPRIGRCRIVGSRRTYEFALPQAARGASRWFFDDLLVRTARAKGAEVREGETVASLGDLRAKVIVGAWGRWGRFDQQLRRGFVRDRAHRNFGFKRHYHGAHDESVIDLYAFRRGYLGVNAVEGGITNICGLVHASRLAGHKGRWDAFVETLRAEEAPLEALYAAHEPAQDGYLSSEPVIFRARSAVEGGIFMIGDASGVIDPLTGNGMAMAVQSALLAAPLLLRLVEQPSRRRKIEDEYRRAHRRFFASRIAWSRRAALLLSRPRLLDAALAAVRSKSVGELFVRRTRTSRDEVERLAAAWFC